jgi:hypothetical protein
MARASRISWVENERKDWGERERFTKTYQQRVERS